MGKVVCLLQRIPWHKYLIAFGIVALKTSPPATNKLHIFDQYTNRQVYSKYKYNKNTSRSNNGS